MEPSREHRASIVVSFAAVLLSAVAGIGGMGGCKTSKGNTWPAFGSYRLPYADGAHVKVNYDFATHNPVGRYDLKGHDGNGSYSIVAAADGWVRFIVDSNSGHGTGDNNYVWIEHPYPFCQPLGVTWPGKPADYDSTCVPCQGDFCNEWTKYSHMATDSTTVDAGLSEGEFVAAGTFLGYESDIGHANGAHLHFEVAKLDPAQPLDDYDNGWTHDWSGGGWLGSPNLLPHICGVGTLVAGDTHTAAACGPSAAPRSGTSRLDWTSPWSSDVNGRPTVSAIAKVVLSEPDEANRVTLETLSLSVPTALVVSREGVLPLPIGTRVEVRSAALVHPVTFAISASPIGRTGDVGRIRGQQVLIRADLVVTVPGRPPFRTRLGTPLAGTAYVATRGTSFQMVLDVGVLGRLTAAGVFPSR
jgi:hypothetical protein